MKFKFLIIFGFLREVSIFIQKINLVGQRLKEVTFSLLNHVITSKKKNWLQMQCPTLGPVQNFCVVCGEFLQLLHTGQNHWICVSSIGCLPGTDFLTVFIMT